MHKLGLDLGSKTCGFAITDSNVTIVSPLENFHYAENNLDQVIQRVRFWLKEYDFEVDKIIIGYPLNLNGTKNSQTERVEKLTEMMQKYFSIPIIFEDERFSTRDAMDELMSYGLKASQRKKIKDKMAATVILENWIQKRDFRV